MSLVSQQPSTRSALQRKIVASWFFSIHKLLEVDDSIVEVVLSFLYSSPFDNSDSFHLIDHSYSYCYKTPLLLNPRMIIGLHHPFLIDVWVTGIWRKSDPNQQVFGKFLNFLTSHSQNSYCVHSAIDLKSIMKIDPNLIMRHQRGKIEEALDYAYIKLAIKHRGNGRKNEHLIMSGSMLEIVNGVHCYYEQSQWAIKSRNKHVWIHKSPLNRCAHVIRQNSASNSFTYINGDYSAPLMNMREDEAEQATVYID